jgi:long-chain acyl-CoA synthetase
MGLARARLEPGEVSPRSCPTPWSNGCWPTSAVLCAGGVSNGIYPTDAAEPGAVPVRRLRTQRAVRRGRRAARQGLEVRERCRGCARSSSSTWRACASFDDPQVISLDALRELGARSTPAHPGLFERAWPAAARRTWRSWSTPRAPPASPRARCTAMPARATPCAATTSLFDQDERRRAHVPSCRCATSPSASAASTSAIYTGAVLNFVENPDTVPENVREIAPTCSPRCRACGRSSTRVMIGAVGGQPAAAARLRAGPSASAGAVADLLLAGQPVPAC